MKLRDYQKELSEKGASLLKNNFILYLALEMRVGKTPIALSIADKLAARKVLFITNKKIIPEINRIVDGLNYSFELEVINYESLHKVSDQVIYDIVICDESHTLGAFPKPNKRARQVKHILSKSEQTKLILLSGTPSPESYSQLFHQFWVSLHNPFNEESFYKWAKSGFVVITQKRISGYMINDYSAADRNKIMAVLNPYIITFTQEQANFNNVQLEDEIVTVKLKEPTKEIIKRMLKDRVCTLNLDEPLTIVGDTAAKLQQKIHQLCSGTIVITDEENKRHYIVLDYTKARYIYNRYYKGYKNKIAIYYLYIAEGEALKETFKDAWTDDAELFNNSDSSIVFISQFQSGGRGINISSADYIIFYNIHFSSELYQQVRQRASEKDKKVKTKLHWIFSEGGIEEKVYKAVQKKQNYTSYYFSRDFL